MERKEKRRGEEERRGGAGWRVGDKGRKMRKRGGGERGGRGGGERSGKERRRERWKRRGRERLKREEGREAEEEGGRERDKDERRRARKGRERMKKRERPGGKGVEEDFLVIGLHVHVSKVFQVCVFSLSEYLFTHPVIPSTVSSMGST